MGRISSYVPLTYPLAALLKGNDNVTIKRLGVWSVARVSAAVYGFFGLIAGAIFTAASLFGSLFAGMDGSDALPGLIFGIGAIVAFPIFYGLMGMIGGALTAFIYNLVAGAVGGVEIETA